jgi:PhnB protein
MASVYPYINFTGNCEEAFNLYRSVFGGDFIMVGRYKDMPPSEETKDMDGEKIMHISLKIGQDAYLMGSDIGGQWAKDVIVGNNVQLSLNASSEAEADRLFAGLSEGGHVTMPMAKTFWGAYFGMFSDRFGTRWMINFDYNQEPKG